MLDPTTITGVTITTGQPDLVIRWRSTAAPGQVHQVYRGQRLVWSGPGTRCEIPVPIGSGSCQITIGACPAPLARRNNLATLTVPGPAPDTVTLTWLGGTYLDDQIQGFRIYRVAGFAPAGTGSGIETRVGTAIRAGQVQPPAPHGTGTGSGIETGSGSFHGAPAQPPAPTLLGTVPAYPGGQITDGFGLGGFGQGGFGRAASQYRWTSGHCEPGPQNLIVTTLTAAGLESPGASFRVTIAGPPRAPTNVQATLEPATSRATLTWSPSPSAGAPAP